MAMHHMHNSETVSLEYLETKTLVRGALMLDEVLRQFRQPLVRPYLRSWQMKRMPPKPVSKSQIFSHR